MNEETYELKLYSPITGHLTSGAASMATGW